MKKLLIFLFLIISSTVISQTFLNGDFENNSLFTCDFNMPNLLFNSVMDNTIAFGNADEVDIQTSGCGYGLPVSGNWFISIHNQTNINSCDEVSMKLSDTLIAGNVYTISYYEYCDTTWDDTDSIKIGLSANSTSFGDLLFKSLPTVNSWSNRVFTFIAPNNGIYITLSFVENEESWVFVDNFIFSSQAANTDLGNDTSLCEGETLVLNASSPGATYLWQDNSTDPTINVTQQGTYWVEVINGITIQYDTINVYYDPAPTVFLGNDTSLCEGETLILDATFTNANYIWQDNSSNNTFNITQGGSYWVEVSLEECSAYDSINVNLIPNPSLELGNDTIICLGESVLISSNISGNGTYMWSNGETTEDVLIYSDGEYILTYSNECGDFLDTINVSTHTNTFEFLNDTAYISNGNITLTTINEYIDYFWSTGENTQSIVVYDTGSYYLTVIDSFSCEATDTIIVAWLSSIESELQYNNLILYPIPVIDELIIDGLEGGESIIIKDIIGKTISGVNRLNNDATVNSNIKLDLKNLPAGIYLILIEKNRQVSTFKIIKTE